MSQPFHQLSLWPGVPVIETEEAKIRRIKGRPGFKPLAREQMHYVPLVLASASSSKINVLKLLGLRFTVDPANVNEELSIATKPEKMVQMLSRNKARAVLPRHPNSIIIGADTVIVFEDLIIGKPKDREDARRILAMLSGETHIVITSLSVVESWNGKIVERSSRSFVTFRILSSQTIDRYVVTDEPMGKAGSYAIQGIGGLLIKKIDGEYTNVLGLPVTTFVDALFDLGYELI